MPSATVFVPQRPGPRSRIRRAAAASRRVTRPTTRATSYRSCVASRSYASVSTSTTRSTGACVLRPTTGPRLSRTIAAGGRSAGGATIGPPSLSWRGRHWTRFRRRGPPGRTFSVNSTSTGPPYATARRRERVERHVRRTARHLLEGKRREPVGREVEHVHPPLRVLARLSGARLRTARRGVQRDDAGVVVVGAVHRARSEAEHEACDPGVRVDLAAPDPRVEGERDAGGLRKEERAAHRPRDALDEERHRLVAIEQPAVLAVAERLLAHGARVHLADGGEERVEPLGGGALVRAEDARVLARERVAEPAFEQRRGADHDRRWPVGREHRRELLQDGVGEDAAQDPLAPVDGAVEERRGAPLLPARAPGAVADEVGMEDVGADEPGVVRLESVGDPRAAPREDRAGEEHADRLAADEARPDHPSPDGEQVREVEEARGELRHPLVPRQHHAQELLEELSRSRSEEHTS